MNNPQQFIFQLITMFGLLASTALFNGIHAQPLPLTFNAGVNDYIVPAGVTKLKITAVGANGGGNVIAPAGTGGTVSAVFDVSPGDKIRAIIGTVGFLQNNRGAGGGATGVINCKTNDCQEIGTGGDDVLLLVGGGGGGTASNVDLLGGNTNWGKGAVTERGDGSGGAGSEVSGILTAGGGGYFSSGGNATFPRGIGAAQASHLGLSPGFEMPASRGAGFGAGGINNQIPRAGGPGGGYTGGDGSVGDTGGNGGSNYIDDNASDQVNTAGEAGMATDNSIGDGYVMIEEVEVVTPASEISGLTLYNPNTNAPVPGVTLTNGVDIDLDPLGGDLNDFNFVADIVVGANVDDVEFTLSRGTQSKTRMETRAPFSLFGDRNNGSNILGANRPFQNVIKNNTGDITMTAVPILNNGSRGTPFILTFTLNNSGIPLRISAEQVSMEIYPNPSTGIAVISGEIAGQTTGTLTIMNPMGQVVYRQEIGESFTEKVDLSNAAKGLYLVKVEGKGFSQVGRLILE